MLLNLKISLEFSSFLPYLYCMQATRKFYTGDKVLILAGPHAGNHILICGIAEDYVAGSLGDVVVRIPKQFAKIVSR